MKITTSNPNVYLYSSKQGKELLNSWIPDPPSPAPGSYRQVFLESTLEDLEGLYADGTSTAAIIIYEYYRLYYQTSPEYSEWRQKAVNVGYEAAILDATSSRLFVDSETSAIPIVSGSLLFIITILIVYKLRQIAWK